MQEDNLELMAELLRDFLSSSHLTKSAFKRSHLGWKRWKCALNGQGTFAEYIIILTAIRMADRQHSQSLSDDTECLTDEFIALYRTMSYDMMDDMVKNLNPNCKQKNSK